MHGWRCRVGALLVVVLALASPACSSGTAAPLHVRLVARPAAAAFDSPIHISASGLPPGTLVTVQARARDYQGHLWQSAADFRASAAGTLTLATAGPGVG
jgi:hypothetical protein